MTPRRMRLHALRTGTLTIALFLLFFYYSRHTSAPTVFRYTKPPHHSVTSQNNRPGIGKIPVHEVNPLQSKALIVFWTKYVDALLEAKPRCNEIKTSGKASHEDEKNLSKSRSRLDITPVDKEQLAAMKSSHKTIVEHITELEPKLSYQAGTRGIAMTAGGKYFGVAVTSVRMLRRSGSELPVEVYLDSWDDYDIATCEKVLPSMNARCLVMSELWNRTPNFGTLLKYQYKTFALLFSSFEHVLFLDADAFPAHNPDVLLDVEPYKSAGLVTWPDFWGSTTSHFFYDIAGIPTPPIDLRRSSESGIMIYNKRIHAASLLLATYYNYYGPDYYYPLFSQGAQGEGDKETFLHAAMALEKPFYDIHTPVEVLGTKLNGTWYTAGMQQADPIEDWALSQAAPRHSSSHRQFTGNDDEIAKAKPLFIHNNLVKMDVSHVFESVDTWRNETGDLVKIWGSSKHLERKFGYDVEKVLWEELTEASCVLEGKMCQQIKAHFKVVYGIEPAAYVDGVPRTRFNV